VDLLRDLHELSYALRGVQPRVRDITPPLPATGVPFRNPDRFVRDVYIIGGTVTDIELDGVSIGVQTFVRQRPNQNIVVNYSVAPTWHHTATW
jgi:hypothetical protein